MAHAGDHRRSGSRSRRVAKRDALALALVTLFAFTKSPELDVD